MYRVLCAYLKQQYSSLTAYKSAFCHDISKCVYTESMPMQCYG